LVLKELTFVRDVFAKKIRGKRRSRQLPTLIAALTKHASVGRGGWVRRFAAGNWMGLSGS